MAIEVGALVAAIEADATQAIAEVKRFQNAASKAAAKLKELQANTTAASRAEANALRELNKAKASSQKLESKIAGRAEDGRIKLTVKDVQLLTAAQQRLTQATHAYNAAVAQSRVATSASSESASALSTLRERHRLAKENLAQLQANAKAGKATAKEVEAATRSENAITQDGYLARFKDRIRAAKTTQAASREQEQAARRENAVTQDDWMSKRAQRARVDKAHTAALKDAAQIEKSGNRTTQTEWEKNHYRRSFMLERELQAEVEDARRAKAIVASRKRDDADAHRTRMRQIREQRAADLQSARMARASRLGAARGPGIGGGVGLSTLGVTGTLAGTMAVGGFLSAANDFQVLQQRLKQVTENGTEVKVLFNELSESANRLRVPVAGVTELFVKLRQSNAMLGLSYGETKQVTDAFAASLRISGATGQTAASALLQFGQAMAKGTLDGDEFRTVAENASEVLRVLERQLGKNRGELLQMREEGKLTARMMADALIKESVELQKRVAELPPTLGQATASFRNSVIRMIGDSQDLQKAMDNIAMFIVRMGDSLQENSALIVGIGKWATGLFAVKLALQGINSLVKGSLALRAMFGLAGGAVVGVAAVGVAGASVGFFAEDLRKAKDEADARKRVNEQAKKDIEQQGRDILAAKAKFDAAYAKKLEVSKTTGFVGDRVQIESDANEARAHLDELTQAYTRTATAKKVLDSGGTDVSTTTPGTGGESKAAKDTTDEFLRAMESVTAAGLQTATQMARLRAIQADANKVIGDGAAPAEALSQALERSATVGNLLGNVIGSSTLEIDEQASSLDLLLENYEMLVDLGLNTIHQSQLIEQMYEEQKEAVLKLAEGTLEYYEALKKVALLEKLMRAAAKSTADKGKRDGPMDNAERRSARLKRQLFEIVSAAPGQLMVDFFGAIGDQIDEGADSVAEQMRRAFGNIFGNIGQVLIQGGMDKLINSDVFKEIGDVLIASLGNMMAKMGIATSVFGKFMLKIKAALANPLVAGFAMVALGAAMVAYGRRMGGIGRGGSGDLGGTLGGLGIGGQPTPGGMFMPTFGPGPMFPNAAQSAPSSAVAPMTVNATIIGPNDPQAQRQIAQLIDNAARRGLTSGGGMRT